jgi:hypothetical protein
MSQRCQQETHAPQQCPASRLVLKDWSKLLSWETGHGRLGFALGSHLARRTRSSRLLRGRVRSPLAAQMWARSHGAIDAEIEGLGIVLTATKRRMPLAGKRCSSSSAIFKSAGLSLLGTAPRSRGAWGMGGGLATHQQELFHQSGFFRGTELVRSLLRS